MSYSNAMQSYRQIQSDSARDASPHQLIMKLFDGLLLDHVAGNEIASNLDNLYEYCERRTLEANGNNDTAAIDEVVGLLKDIHNAWLQIPTNNRQPENQSGFVATAER